MSIPVDLLGLALLLLAGLALFATWMIAYTAWVLTHPPRRTYAWAASRSVPGDPGEVRIGGGDGAPSVPLRYEAWTLDVAGDSAKTRTRLEVWDIAGAGPGGPLVIVIHGWGDSRVTMLSRLPALAPVASRVLMFDLPGHGESAGVCSLGIDEASAVGALIDRVAVDAPRMVLYGFSLGAGIALEVAANRTDIAAVIAEAPYRFPRTPAANVLRSRGLPHRWNLPVAMSLIGAKFRRGLGWAREDDGSKFDRVKLAARLPCPLLVLHGERDDICPIEDGRAITAAAAKSRFVAIADAGHLTMWTSETSAEDATQAVQTFLRDLRSSGPLTSSPSPADR